MQLPTFAKLRQFLLSLKLEFPEKDMEQDYWFVKKKDMVKDFKFSLEFLMLFNFVIAIMSLAIHSWTECYIATGTVGILFVVYCLRRYLTKYIQFLSLVIIFAYEISRLFMSKPYYSNGDKSTLFLYGYGLAHIQGILVYRLLKITQKVFGIFIMLIVRFLLISLYLEPGSFFVPLFLRHVCIEFFLSWTFYTQELAFRKIYRDFVRKKEELLKFKEFLAESLPQSLVVVSFSSKSLQFWNKTFQDTFKYQDFKSLENHLEALQVDESTIREIAIVASNFNLKTNPKNPLSLAEVLEKFRSDCHLYEKTISLVACTTPEGGSRRVLEVNLKKVKWDNEDAIAVLFNDITYQENLMALKLANVNKDKVIATVSHELRTPLNGIIGILDITKKRIDNPEIVEYLSLCKDNAHLLLSLVNSILDLQQISIGKLKLNLVNLDVRKVVNGIAQLFYFQCKEKNLLLDCNIHKDVPTRIHTDENRLKQVLINLIGNAIKFTSKGVVRVEITPSLRNAERLQISVTDTGIGIKREDQKHLFKMYSKIEDGESVNKHGVGLGLTISNALAIILNGGIENGGIRLDSEYGAGSKFYFDIQRNLKDRKEVQSTKSELSSEGKFGMNRTINDSETTRGLLAKESNVYEERMEEDCDSSRGIQEADYREFFVPFDLQSKLSSYILVREKSSPIGFMQSPDESPRLKQTLAHIKDDYKTQQPSLSYHMHKLETIIEMDKSDLNILIVDDNPFNLLVAKNLVQEFGCKIATALGGQEAIDTIKKSLSEGTSFKVIFMDCQMPIMDGFETTKTLRAMMEREEIPEVPIFGWTANNSEEDVKRCYEAGMIGHLPKPSSKAEFYKVISHL